MKFFGKKDKKEVQNSSMQNPLQNMNMQQQNMPQEPPQLPELPRFPEMSNNQMKINSGMNQNINSGFDYQREELPQLPSYPRGSFGEKFSQNAIKDAVSGEEEGDEDYEEADDSYEENKMMPSPQIPKIKTHEISPHERMPSKQGFVKPRRKETEPIFVRMDKFEDSLKAFENAKNKIIEMEKMLKDIKSVRSEEERELHEWESEIQQIKSQFEKIDSELFSKV